MAELIKSNMLAHFAFYRRSRLLLAFVLVALLLMGLSSLPAIFYDSGVQSFNALKEIFSGLCIFLVLLGGALVLFHISSHFRGRSLKMVFTKPCSPSVWLASVFFSALAVSLLLNLVLLGSVVALSYIWHVPVRAGLVFISADTFIASVAVIAYIMLLSSLAHPAIAVTFALIFNAEMFYNVDLWTRGAIQSGNASWALRVLEKIFHGLYMALPIFYAYAKQTENIYSSFRVMHTEWKYLCYSLAYALVLSAFCYFLALLALQRKKLI
jgi:hypothetical protein